MKTLKSSNLIKKSLWISIGFLLIYREQIPSNSHSQIWPYFISYLLTCEGDLFEVLEIMAQMWYYIIFLSHKPTKVTSDFIVNYLKKVIGGATTQKNLKNNTKTLIYSTVKLRAVACLG